MGIRWPACILPFCSFSSPYETMIHGVTVMVSWFCGLVIGISENACSGLGDFLSLAMSFLIVRSSHRYNA